MILQRIKTYLDFKGIKIATFERSVGMSNASFGKALKNDGAIGSDKIENILSVYKDISPSWLLTGEGPMLQNSASDALSVSSSSSDKESLTLSDNTGPVLMQNGPGSHNNHQKVIGADGTASGREMAMQATIELQKKMIEDRDNEIAFLRDMLRKGLE